MTETDAKTDRFAHAGGDAVIASPTEDVPPPQDAAGASWVPKSAISSQEVTA